MPSLMDNLLAIVQGMLAEMNTATPGVIVKYDATTGKADVQPSIREKYTDETKLDPPVITNVPVLLPRTSGGSLTLPLAPGDPVLLVFAQRSIDRWASEGGLVDSGDVRHHSMSDAFAIPGAFSFKDGPTGETGTVLKNGSTKVKIAGEKVAIGNATAELLDKVAEGLEDTATSTANGFPLSNAASIAAAAAAIRGIQGSL